MDEKNPYRRRALEELKKALTEGRVDNDAIPVLEALNSSPRYVTTSSCSGRIQLIEVEDLGRKERSNWVAKFHSWPGEEAILERVRGWRGRGYLILQCQSPIFHVRCRTLQDGVELVNLARECGFKYSSIRSVKLDSKGTAREFSAVVELLTPSRMDLPLGHGGELFVDEATLRRLLPLFLRCFNKGKKALRRFTKSISQLSPQG
ncbi:MAG: hypothetical protein DRN40_04935 [Thermoplasmata archaeon]|nr:MAG: hypothetical protein DRN40_04935 [Thermoplasmata archaeon]